MVRGGRHLGACQRRKLSSSLPKAADSESVLQEDSQVLFVLTWVCIAHLSLHCNSALTNHVILAKLHSLCVFFGPVCNTWGFPCSSVHKESACGCLQCWRPGFDSWVGKIPWRRKWKSTPVFLPGKFHGQRSLVDYSPWGRKNRTQLRE